jgi:hypothetical protein
MIAGGTNVGRGTSLCLYPPFSPVVSLGEHMIEKRRKKPESDAKEFANDEDKETENIYDEDNRQDMLENDEITASEEGFMRGWDGTVEGGKKHKKDSDHKDMASVELSKEQYKED